MQNSLDYGHYLSNVTYFKFIDQEAINDCLQVSKLVNFEKDQYLFHQGDTAAGFYIVIEGRIKLTQLDSNGVQVIHNYPGPGEAFGIIAALREINFPVTAQAINNGKLLVWSDTAMKEMMVQHPQLGLNSIRILSNFIMDFQDRIQELSSKRVERRIAHALLRVAEQTGKKEGPAIVIDFKITRQDIAEMSGTTIFTVSRTLSQWERDEIITCQPEAITILNPHKLFLITKDQPED